MAPRSHTKRAPAPVTPFRETAYDTALGWRVGATARSVYEENTASAAERCCSAARRAGAPNGRSNGVDNGQWTEF